nr:hypothetical protein [Tanacetum cinerariifolium]
MNQVSYNSNSPGFDQPQPSQSLIIHQPPQELSIQEMEDLKQQYLDELKRLSNLEYRDEIKIAELKENFNGMGIEIRKKEKLMQQEQWAYLSTHPSKHLTSLCYDDDDEDYTLAVTPVLSTEEPDHSLSMGDEHLDTIPATESDEFIKSGVENLIPIPNQIEDFSESNEEFSSTDDDSFSFDKIDYVEASPPDFELVSSEEPDNSLSMRDKHLDTIKASNDNPIPFYNPVNSGNPPNLTPSGESDFFLEVDAFLAVEDESTSSQFPKSYLDPEGDMLLFEAFLNDDHSSDVQTKSSSTSLNSLLEETHNFDNSLTECTTFSHVLCDAECESDSSDDQSSSDEDVLKKIDLPRNNSLSFAEKESFHFDIPPFSRPPAKPPDGDTGILNIKMMGDIYDQKAFMHKLMITLASHQEKSPDLLSHRYRTVTKFNTHHSHLNIYPMLINGQNNPPLDVLFFYFYPL